MSDNKYDAIIIGSGLGGLVAGATLAKYGKKVLLIEQHEVVGGCSSTFTRKGFTVDVGLHLIDGFDNYGEKAKIFDELDVFSNVEFIKQENEFYRFINGRVDIVVPDDHLLARQVLKKEFPEDAKAIDKFFNTIIGLYKEIHRFGALKKWQLALVIPAFPLVFPNLVKWGNKTVGDLIDSLGIKNNDLKLVLLGNIQFYATDPYELALAYYGPAQGSFFMGGSFYVKGGSQKLANYFASVITNNGGEIILQHLVTKILTKNGEAIGVECHSRKRKDKDIALTAYADNIIANAALPNVANELLPPEEGAIIKNLIKDLEICHSHYSLYLGFDVPLTKLGNHNYEILIWPEEIRTPRDIGPSVDWDFRRRRISFTDYSQLDSGVIPPGKGVAIASGTDRIENWENLSREEYIAKKEEAKNILIERLDKVIPGIKDHIEYADFATPITIKRYTLNTKGTSYGFKELPSQAGKHRLGNKSPIPHLWFASAWVFPGGGFTSTILSGYHCAKAILKESP